MGVNCGLAAIEMTDSQGLIVGAIFIAALIGTIVWACVSEVKKRKKQLLELESEEYTPPPIEEHIARLISRTRRYCIPELIHRSITAIITPFSSLTERKQSFPFPRKCMRDYRSGQPED